MQPGQYAYALRHNGHALVEAARNNLDLRVPGCPGWDVRALVRHTGGVHRFWGTIALKRLADPSEVGEIAIPDTDEDLLAWFEEGVEWLVGVLAHADPGEQLWTWSRRKNMGFVQRRVAQETAVHRWDAESASGIEEPIELSLAADGIDEIIDTFVPVQEAPITGSGQTILLFESDSDMDWPLRLGREGLELGFGDEEVDVEVRATASDLLLMLWGRVDPKDLDVSGDSAVLNHLLDALDTE